MWLPRRVCALAVLLAVAAADPQYQRQPQPWTGRNSQVRDENPIIFEDALPKAKELAQAAAAAASYQPAYSPTNKETPYHHPTTTQTQERPGLFQGQRKPDNQYQTNSQNDYHTTPNAGGQKQPAYQPTNTQNNYQTNTHNQNDYHQHQSTNTGNQKQPAYQNTNTQNTYQTSNQNDYQQSTTTVNQKQPSHQHTNTHTNYPTNTNSQNDNHKQNSGTQNYPAHQPTNTQSSYPTNVNDQNNNHQSQNTGAKRPSIYQPTNTQNNQQTGPPSPNAHIPKDPSYPLHYPGNIYDHAETPYYQQTNYTKHASNGKIDDEGAKVKYHGCQVWNVIIDDDSSKLTVVGGLTRVQELTSWGGNHTAVDFLVKPENQAHVGDILRRSNIKYSVVIEDLQSNIDSENPQPSEEEQDLQDRKGHSMTWLQYHRLANIHGYLNYLANTYPDICTVKSIGNSHEGRELKILRISNGRPNNKAVLIDGGIHAREWISPATVTYIINEFVENFDSESESVRNMDWYFIPVLNPDGYEYTHTIDRLWRKNRKGYGPCSGVDLNRNFGYKWGGQGTSKNPCSEVYPGTHAFSEPESKALSDFVALSSANFKLYASYHSYGEYILYPWGYDKFVPEDYMDLERVGNKAAQAIVRAGGSQYRVGASSLILYPASGGSDDWAKAVARIKYTYTVELSDRGRYGFILPSSYITKVARESLAALRVMAEAAYQA